MPSHARRNHSPDLRRSTRLRKAGKPFASPEKQSKVRGRQEHRGPREPRKLLARREPPRLEPLSECAKECAIEEDSLLHEFLFVALLLMMLLLPFTHPLIIAPSVF